MKTEKKKLSFLYYISTLFLKKKDNYYVGIQRMDFYQLYKLCFVLSVRKQWLNDEEAVIFMCLNFSGKDVFVLKDNELFLHHF